MGARVGSLTVAIATAVACAGAILSSSPAAGSQADLTIQFRRVDEYARLVRADGSFVDTTLKSEYWSHILSVHDARRLGNTTTLSGELAWTDNYYVGRTQRTQTPSLHANLADPRFGLSAIYQPTRSSSGVSPVVGFQPTGARSGGVEILESQQMQMAGYLALPQIPRLDVSWQRTHRNNSSFAPQQTSVARTARLAHTLGVFSLQAGYSDVAHQLGSPKAGSPDQTAWDGQGGFSIVPRRDLSLSSRYGFSTVSRRAPGVVTDRNTNQNVSVAGGYRPRSNLSLDLNYALLHLATSGRQRFANDSHDGALALGYHPIPIVTLSAAGTLRTNTSEAGYGLARAVVGSARVGGRARRGWDLDAGAAHSWTWDRTHPGVAVDAVSTHTRLAVRKSLELNGGADLSSSAAGGTALLSSIGVSAHPVKSLGLNLTQSGYQAGSSLFRTTSRSRSRSLDLTWRPRRTLDVRAGLGESGAQPNNRPRTTNERVDLRWLPSAALQLTGSYTHSSSPQTGAGTAQLVGHESFASRLTAALGRTTTMSAGVAITDPGVTQQSRQYDASVTKSFGR